VQSFVIRANAAVALAVVAFVLGQAPVRQALAAPGPGIASEYVVVERTLPENERALTDTSARPDRFDIVPVPAGWSAVDYARLLQRIPGVATAEPDARVRAAAVPNDTYYAQDQAGYYTSIMAPEAWDLSVGREEVVVAILDSGADTSHPDLASRLWTNTAEIPGNGVDDDGNGCVDDVHGCRITRVTPENQALCGYDASDALPTGDVLDDNGRAGSQFHSHGTMVAGIVGAAGNNGRGVAGVAWNVRLMIVKVLDCGSPGGGTPSGFMADVADGIDYARRMGASVINLSLASDPGDTSADTSRLRSAIAAAEADGILIVTAAGNYGSSSDPRPGYPAAYSQYSNLVAVGASNWTSGNTWASYSAYGSAIDFAAPGNQVTSTVRTDVGLAVPYGKAEQGTSFSAPLASGMFALMVSRNSRLSHETYIQLAREAATPAPEAPHGQPWAGAGIINIGGAVGRVPMLITGSALNNWVDVPAGTLMEARIASRQCGATTTTALGPVSRFELLVAPDAVSSGCGAPGREVDIYIGGTRAEGGFAWGNALQELAYTGQEVTTVTPPPGPLVVQQLTTGWNNVAHLDGEGSPPGALAYLPASWSAIYAWNPFEGNFLRLVKNAPDYVQSLASVERYDAYWVYTNAQANAANVNPQPAAGRAEDLVAGWNNVVYTGTSKQASTALTSIAGKYSIVYAFDNATGTWKSFVPGQPRALNTLGGLLTMQVFWVHMTEAATLVMN